MYSAPTLKSKFHSVLYFGSKGDTHMTTWPSKNDMAATVLASTPEGEKEMKNKLI